MPHIEDPPALDPAAFDAQRQSRLAALAAHHRRMVPAETNASQVRPVVVNGVCYESATDAAGVLRVPAKTIYAALRGRVPGIAARWGEMM